MSALRPLPPNPSLEFEKKRAKELLRQQRTGDADIQLAVVQLGIAREYGFASWPKLVHYFEAVERGRHSHRFAQEPGMYEGSVRGLLAQVRNRMPQAAWSLATYVPRLYGMKADEVFAATISEDDARLAVARTNGFPSWSTLKERLAAEAPRRRSGLAVNPIQRAVKAMESGDLDGLHRLTVEYPELLHPSDYDLAVGISLLRSALHVERRTSKAAMGPIVDWLVAKGFDLQLELNQQLCGQMRMEPGKVRWLLDRGADPQWVAPNGIPVLEHALLRYWNKEALDVLAARARPRKALWIAASLGDVDGVKAFLDANGKPTPAARALRPDFAAAATIQGSPMHPEPDDEMLLMEAFTVAMTNGATVTLEYMVSRGFSVDSLTFGTAIISFAIGNAWVPVVESLVRCGANLDLRSQHDQSTPREMARDFFEQMPRDAGRRRIAELCGLDPVVILADRDARPVPPPEVHPHFRQALELAGDDAWRLGQSGIGLENLLLGLLRTELPLMMFTRASGMDIDRFRAEMQDRVLQDDDRVNRPSLSLLPEAQEMITAAIAIVTQRRLDLLRGDHLLYAMVRDGKGPAVELLARYGGNLEAMKAALERSMEGDTRT